MSDRAAFPLSLPALLRHARRTYGEAMRTALVRDGYGDIPINGLYVIGGLALDDGGVPIGRFVRELGISKQATGQLVDALMTRGYVYRTPDKADRRQLIVTLTERGREALKSQTAARRAVDAALLSTVGSDALESTRHVLTALIDIGRPALPEHRIDEEGTI